MLLLFSATGVWASEDLVQTRDIFEDQATLEVSWRMKSENSWDELFEQFVKLSTGNTRVTRFCPYVDLRMRLKHLQFSLRGRDQDVSSSVYVEWDNRWHKIGTIKCFIGDWHASYGAMSAQFYRTKNDPDESQDYGTFFTTMITDEQRMAQTMPFFYVPSAKMIQSTNGEPVAFRLKIENDALQHDTPMEYRVSHIINCQIDYYKPATVKVRHKSMTEVEAMIDDQRLFNIDQCTALRPIREKVTSSFMYDLQIAGCDWTEGFANVEANDKRTAYYDLALKGLCDFWLWYRPSETFLVEAVDNAEVAYIQGTHLYTGDVKRCGFKINWPSEDRILENRFRDQTPPFAYADTNTGEVKLSWHPRSDLLNYVYVYRAESPEDSETAEASLDNANWKYVCSRYMGNGWNTEFTDKIAAYNKRYTYAFLQLPFVGADNVNTKPYERDTTKLSKGLVVRTTQVVTTPSMTIDVVQDKSVTDKIALQITPSKLPLKESKQNYDVYRRTEGEEEWNKMETLSINNDGKTTATYTDRNVDACTVYEYKVSTYAKNDDVGLDNLLEGEPVRMSVLERSHVTKLDVSKGDREQSVMVTWQAKQIGSMTTTYYIQRRPVNSTDEYVTIHTEKGTADRYSYEDKNVDAGQYYDYRVEAYTEGCQTDSRAFDEGDSVERRAAEEPALTFSNSEGETGFCMSKGIISGRVSYGTGSSVEGVTILLTPQEDDQEVSIVSHSQKISNGGTISWKTTGKDMRALACKQQPFTLQFYVHPLPGMVRQPVVTVPGLSSLLVGSNDSTATLQLGSLSFTQTLSTKRYNHITLAIDGNTAWFTLDGDTIHTESITLTDDVWNDDYDDKDEVALALGGQQFQGYLREMRLWTRVLSAKETATTFNRTLSGLETGLAVYWPLDEGLSRHAFDVSCTGGVKNQRHPVIDVNVEPDTWVPTANQLSLYGITNKNGEYTIRGVPFTGTGTNYTITPQKTLHEFMPSTLNGFVSKQSLSLNNNDFTDESSFEYRGTVSYLNTDIPVDSVTFQIDGSTVMMNNQPVMTDANGQFTISVPIGSHAIQAVRTDHVLSRYPETGTVEFLEAGIINFTDSTLVNVAGRINGGADAATEPLGFRRIDNRLGVATMTLCLEKEANNRFNLNADRMPSGKQTAIATSDDNMNSRSYYPADAPTDIVIHTDPKTGEFSAMLPPLRYVIKSITFPKGAPYNDEKFFKDNLPAIDARMKPGEYVDTLTVDDQKLEYKAQARLLLAYRRNPTIFVAQSGVPEGAFGMFEVEDPDDDEKFICLLDTVTTAEAEANPNLQEGDFKGYKYTDRPVFQQGKRYTMKIYAQEQYDYYDTDGTLAKTYKMLPPDGIIHVNNSLSSCAIVADSALTYNGKSYEPGDRLQSSNVDITLPEDGAVVYTWICGAPNFSGDRSVPMTINLESNRKVTLWEGPAPQKEGALKGYIIGSLLTGTRFLTKGPDKPSFVLRDPGGSGSSSTLQNDTIKTDYDQTSTTWGASEKYVATITTGTYVKFKHGGIVANAVLMGTNEVDARNTLKLGEVGKWTRVHDESNTIITTVSEKFSTATDAAHVGRKGDTYIGNGVNIYYGEGRYLKFSKKNDGTIFLTDSTGITSAMELGTSYNFSEYYLVNEVLPEWKRLRDNMLEHVDTWNDVPPPSQIHDSRPHYYTIYKKGDDKYGKTNPDNFIDYVWASDLSKPTKTDKASYIIVVPDDVTHYVDTISSFNTNIANWENIIALNEEDKVLAIRKGNGTNISYSGGSTITHSLTTSSAGYLTKWDGKTETNSINWGVRNKYRHEVNKVGWGYDFEAKGTRGSSVKSYDISETKKNVSYTITDKNALTALSISVYPSTMGWGPIFITEGGQTMRPYEGGTKVEYHSEYKGTELDKATMRIEKCDISVENANVSDVPSGEAAFFNLHLYNNSETQSPSTYTLYPHPANDLKGGQMMLDGKPIPSTGLSFFLPYGEVKKTLVLKQGDLSVTDFSYMLRLQSEGDSSRVHSDWKTLTAHFVPTSAPVTIESDLAVINSKVDSATVTLRNLDRNFLGLKGVRLQYRRQGTDAWTLAQTWINEAYRSEYPNAQPFPAEGNPTQRIRFTADGTYELRAQSFSLFGNDDVVRESAVITLVQDVSSPQAMSVSSIPRFLTLMNRNDIHLTFNEPIRKAAISQAANVRIVEETDPNGNTPDKPHVVDEADYSLVLSDSEIYFNFKDAVLPKMHNRIYRFKVFDVPDQYGNPSDTITWLMQCDLASVFALLGSDEITLQKGHTVNIPIYLISIEDGHSFTLSGQPAWVKLSQTEGTTNSNMEDIMMTILPTAPIGRNDINIRVTEANGISNTLSCRITVEGNKPQWAVQTDDYEDNMVIIGRLKNDDGEWSDDQRVLVGAFDDNGNCRGLAYTDYTLNKVQPNGTQTAETGFVNLMVYGNKDNENITFRIYNEKNGFIYRDVLLTDASGNTVTSITFTPDERVGSYDNPVVFTTGDQLMQNLELTSGWNWVSFYLDTDKTIEELLAPYAYTITNIKTKDSFSDSYFDETAAMHRFGGDLCKQKIEKGVMYKIYSLYNVQIPIAGNKPDDEWQLSLHPGWNWIGVPYHNVLALSEAFPQPQYDDYVKDRYNSAFFNERSEWEGTLMALLPGCGYVYRSMDAPAAPLARNAHTTHNAPATHYHDYSDNMTIVMQPLKGDNPMPNTEVSVYMGGTLRGTATTNTQGLAYLTIAGSQADSETEMTIHVGNAEIVVPHDIWYGNDTTIGNTADPYVLQLIIPEIASK